MGRNLVRVLICVLSVSVLGQGMASAAIDPGVPSEIMLGAGRDGMVQTDAATVAVAAPADGATVVVAADEADLQPEGLPEHLIPVVDRQLEVTAVDPDGNPVTAFPHSVQVATSDGRSGAPASVTSFDPGVEIAFVVDEQLAAGVNPGTVAIYHRAAVGDEWSPLPSAYDPTTGTVVAHADQLSQFAVLAQPADAGPAALDGRPTVVLDPDDDLGFAEWPDGRESELTRNLQLVSALEARLVALCNADVVVTRGAERFVDRSIRAAVAAGANPDLTVTLAFNALNGQPWGVEDDGGVLAWASDADDRAFAQRFLDTIPQFTGRPSTAPVNGIAGFSPYPELDAVPGPYAHVELLYLDHNFDHPVITDQFVLVVDAAVAAVSGQLVAQGFACDGSELPTRPAPETLGRLRDLGFQNYQIYGADPISFSTGNFVTEEPIFTLPGLGEQLIDFTLTYNSQDDRPGIFGPGWSFEYNTALRLFSDGSALVRMADGHSLVFEPQGAGWADPPGGNATLRRVAGGLVELVLNTFDKRRFRVDPATGVGVLDSQDDRQGNRLRFEWGPATAAGLRPLLAVTDEADQRVEVTSDGDGRATLLTHPDGRTWEIGYQAGRLDHITDPRDLTRRFEYSAEGLLDRVTDGDGIAFVTNTYDGDGRVVAQTNGSGDERTVDYQDDRTVYTDALGNQTTFVFNDLGQVTETIDAAGGRTSTEFDDDYNPAVETDANGNTTRTEFDDEGRPTRRIDALGHEVTFTYNEFGDLVETEQPDGLGGRRTTGFEVNPQGLVTRTTFDDGSTTTATYDEHGDRTSSTDANGNTTTYELDGRGNVIRIVDPLGAATTATFSLANRLLTSTDANGNTTTHSYDAVDNRVTTTDAIGSVWRYEYNASNKLTSETDPLGRTTTYTYDENLNLVGVVHPDGTSEAFEVDGEYGVIGRTDQRGNTVRTEYDALLRPTAVTDELGNRWTSSYDPVGNLVETSDPLGNVTTFEYDALNRRVKTVDAVGGEWSTTYDAAGNVTTTTAPDGTTTVDRYDALGRVVGRVDEEGNRIVHRFDAVGNIVAVTDRRGNVTASTYDPLSRIVEVTNPDGGVTRRRYDPIGNLLAVTDPEGGTVLTAYDAVNRPTVITDQLGVTSSTTYDAVGNPISNTDGAGHIWRLEYDAMDRLTAEVSPLGDREVTHYDENGNVTGRTDPDGVRTELVYNARNELVEVIGNAQPGATAGPDVNVRTRYERVATGWLTASIDGNGHRTTYRYDPLGRLIGRDDPLGRTSSRAYDPVGNVVEQVDGNGNRSTMTYTADGELASTTFADGSTVAFTHDADNFRATMTDSLGTTTWERNWRGDEERAEDANGNVVEHRYDLNANVTAIIYPNGFRSNRTFDAANRLAEMLDPAGTIRYRRDELGRPVAIESPNGMVSRIEYDAEGKTVTIDHLSPHPSYARGPADELGTSLRFDYAYSVDDQIVERRKTEGRRVLTTTYGYDGLDRLTSSDGTDGRSSSYRYDPVGNRIAYDATDNPDTNAPNDSIEVQYTFDAADQLTLERQQFKRQGLEVRRDFDGNGSLITQTSTRLNPKGKKVGQPTIETFRYNQAGDLLSDSTMTFERDGIGRALTVTEKRKTSELVYDDLWLIAQEGAVDEIYLRDDDQALRSQTSARPAKTEVLLYDLLGTVYGIADKNGKSAQLADFDDYGQLIGQPPHRSVFGFAGELQDQASGRLHHYARSYDTLTGRFLQRDRIGGDLTTPITQHPYLYGLANPVNNADLLGYFGCCGIDVDIPNPIDAVKSVGGKVVDGVQAAGEWAWEHKEAIAVSIVVGAAVACVLATAGICAGVGLAVASGSALAAATPFIVGGASAVAFGVTDRATDDNPDTRAFDITDIGVDLGLGIATAGLFRFGGAAVRGVASRAATSRAGQVVAQSTVGRATSTAVASAAQLSTTVKTRVSQAAATAVTQARSQAGSSRVVLNARNFIGRFSGRQAAQPADDLARLSSRVDEFHDVLDPIAQNSRTTAVMSTRQGVDVVTSGGRDLSPAQRALARETDILGRLPGAHAEVTALDAAAKAGLDPSQIAVSRPICPDCQTAIREAGGEVLPGALDALWPR